MSVLGFQQNEVLRSKVDRPNLARLAEFVLNERRRKNLSQEGVRDRGGPSVGWLSTLETGQMIDLPKRPTLEKLARALEADLPVLLEMAGYGHLRSDYIQSSAKPENHGAAMVSAEQAGVTSFGRQASEGMPSAEWGRWAPEKKVPTYGPMACGAPLSWTTEDIREMYAVPRGMEDDVDVAFIVSGTSLSALGVHHGDRVGVKLLNGVRPKDGDVVAVQYEGAYMAKVYRSTKVGEYLESHEVGQRPEPLLFGDDVHLIGIVTTHTRSMKR